MPRARKDDAASVVGGDRREGDDETRRVRVPSPAPGVYREHEEEREVREESDDPRRRRDVKDPVVRRRVRRVHAGDREPLGLLVSRVGDREVLEPDPEEGMVENIRNADS